MNAPANVFAGLGGDLPAHASFSSVAVKWVRHWNANLFSFAVERPPSFRFRSGEFVMIGLAGGRPPADAARLFDRQPVLVRRTGIPGRSRCPMAR
ncbi:hypothetical protein AB5I41_25400 [Sphingomonas sp. MMS24-JH45]